MKKVNEGTLWIIGTFAGFALLFCALIFLPAQHSHSKLNTNATTHAQVANKQANFEFVLYCDKNSKCKIYTEEIR